ncbi:class I SAM-dependent methyltransferase [Portibacter lacus]|uniref:SAM-dependent methyltransferase n=1 Tax=Portibacter lacus TaxID=1099794 RepID=A0AA37SNC1_9BACT|nr:class I SAM-dependent methyltransferase [Portibacter lacus]GLR16750.1 SAM-dependent methyltransferase [Portibacter lacus]
MEIKKKIFQAYEKLAKSYNNKIDHKPHNAYYDRPNTLSLLKEVKGKKILDAACGPGKYAEILSGAGAEVIGYDISPKMIAFAKERNPGNDQFYVHDISEPFDKIEDGEMDVVLCALALHYLEDWTITMSEFFRVLKAGGQLVISIEHPFFEYTYFKSEKYFEVEHVRAEWGGFGKPVEVNSYRRPLAECINPILQAGFMLEKVLEPKPTEEFKKADRRYYDRLNKFPSFMCISAVKP